MKEFIKLQPIYQTGHNCKITAIATIDKFFGRKLGFEPIPLHKNKSAHLSVRELSKTKGSVQGELLEVRQFSEIFSDLGYETELADVQDDFNSFQAKVTQSIKNGNLIIACFAVDCDTGLPSTDYDGENEHAAILHGFDDETGELNITHWGEHVKTTMRYFFDSSMVLPKQRDQEYYVYVKIRSPEKKYDLYWDQTGAFFPIGSCHRKSLIPAQNSGFRGKLIIIKQPELQKIHDVRDNLSNHLSNEDKAKIDELFLELQIKIEELIEKGSKKKGQYKNYQDVAAVAIELMNQLNNAKKQCLDDKTLSLNEFKMKCTNAIEKARPEFRKHRGWHQLNSILRKIIGVISALTIIPGLVVALGAKKGYIGSFFKTPKTDSEQKLESLKHGLDIVLNRY